MRAPYLMQDPCSIKNGWMEEWIGALNIIVVSPRMQPPQTPQNPDERSSILFTPTQPHISQFSWLPR